MIDVRDGAADAFDAGLRGLADAAGGFAVVDEFHVEAGGVEGLPGIDTDGEVGVVELVLRLSGELPRRMKAPVMDREIGHESGGSMNILALHYGPAVDVVSEGSGAWWDKDWRTGFYKVPHEGPQWLGYQGFRGDGQADTRYHGGVDKAVCVYPSEHYEFWNGVDGLNGLPTGAFGENLTTRGLIEEEVCVGDVYEVGSAIVQVSQPRQPCWKLARRWRVKDLAAEVERNGRTGFYFRVLRHGEVAAGDVFHLRERPFAEWSLGRCNRIMHQREGGAEADHALAQCPALSGSWKDGLWNRGRARGSDPSARRDQPK